MKTSPLSSSNPMHGAPGKIHPGSGRTHPVGIEGRTDRVSSAIKTQDPEGLFPGKREFELITLPEEEEPTEEAAAEEKKAQGAAASSTATPVSHPNTRRPKTTRSTAGTVRLVFAHSLSSLSNILSRAAVQVVASNVRERERHVTEETRKRQQKEKEIVHEAIKADQQHYDRKLDTIRADQARSERARKQTRGV